MTHFIICGYYILIWFENTSQHFKIPTVRTLSKGGGRQPEVRVARFGANLHISQPSNLRRLHVATV